MTPNSSDRPTFQQTIADILESIAQEEMAIANIMNAEGGKLHELVGQYSGQKMEFQQLLGAFREQRGKAQERTRDGARQKPARHA